MALIDMVIRNIEDIVKVALMNQKKIRYRNKKNFIDSQKEKCAKCGETRAYVLDFHHRDLMMKEFTIGQVKKGSQTVIQNEIDKYVVLCANCHRAFYYLEKEQDLTIEQFLGK